ncbi:hypothetical protein C8F01DRAFT_1063417 [Mycena amicta]|nr:hypothetical protein C8F01DRAFT_1063417 [Mycena amicta]
MDIDDWGSASSTDSQSDSEGPSSPPPPPAQTLPKLKLILPPLRELQQQKTTPTPATTASTGLLRPRTSRWPFLVVEEIKIVEEQVQDIFSQVKVEAQVCVSEYADESGSKAPPRPVKLKPLKEVLARLLVLLKKKDDYAFFLKPVNAALVPGYADLIKRPMDLATMTVKVQRGRYRSLEEFTDDFRLVTGNAKIFNPPDSIYYIEAERLETWGLDQISKAASTVIQYETDWNIEIKREDVTAEDYAAALEDVEMAGPERSRSPSVSLGVGSLRRGPLRPRAAKEEPNVNVPVKETIDAEGRMPGSKDGMGAFPAGSAWAKTMLSLKLKGKRYKTKKERLRVETHGPPTLTDGSLDYRAVEDPFTYLSALVPDPPARPQLTPIFPPPRKPPPPTFQPSGTPSRDTPEPSGAGETPAPNVLDTYPLPTLLPHDLQTTTTTIPPHPTNLRHWTVHRNFGNRRPLDPPPAYERTWEEPREAHMLDFGAFAELAGLFNGALRGAGIPVVETQTREETDALVKDAVRASLEVPSRDQFVAPTTVLDLQPKKEYWGKERTLEAESYIVDMVYGGVEGLAYVRSLAEFVSTPAGDEDVKMEDDTKPRVFPLGCSLASWVEQTIVGPLTEGRHQLLNRVVQELSIPKREMKVEANGRIDIDDKIPAQIALARDVRPVAFTGLKLIQQVLTHKLDMAALLYAPTEVAQSEAEWAGAAIGVGVGAGSTAQTKAVLDHTANLLERLQTPPVKDELPDEGGGGESKTLRNLRLNLLALVRRAPVDTIAMLPPELVREDLRPFIPTLPAHGTLSYIQ